VRENYIIRDDLRYVPEEHGARCEDCPLRDIRAAGFYVPSEMHNGATMTVVAEAPGRNEEEVRRPLVGPSGSLTMQALLRAGVKRERTNLVNTLLCRPPGTTLEKFLAGLGLHNRNRRAQKKPPIPSPITCCLPRLLEDIADAKALLLLGAASRSAVYGASAGSERSLMSSRGFPSTVLVGDREVPALSTVHPAFVLRAMRWAMIFDADIAKAVRMARGELHWTYPQKVYFPRPLELYATLEKMRGEIISYDVETRPAKWQYGSPESTTDVLRCIGIGTAGLCVCVPFESVERGKTELGWRAWYSADEWAHILDILTEFFGRETEALCAHNEQYDRLVMRHQLPNIPIRRKMFDTVIAHHVAWSEFPHDLGFLSAQYTDSIQHKVPGHDKWDSDQRLHHYCMDDVAVTSHAALQLARTPRFVEQRKVFETDMWLGVLCRELHDFGIAFDTSERDRHFAELTIRMEKARIEFREQALRATTGLGKLTAKREEFLRDINPGSPHHTRRFLFDICGLEPVPEKAGGTTASGEPSVSRDNLLYLIDRGLPPELEETLQRLIDFREASKLRGTYCTVEPMADGRVRANWNPHVVVSGRLSTSNPNLLNIKGPLRSMYCASPGHLLVFCDKAQLELRIISWLAQDEKLIETFLSGKDVHKVNTAAILGIRDPEEVTKSQRKFGKTFTYAVQYGAAAEKAWRMVRNYREPDGSRPYKGLTLVEAEKAFVKWWIARVAIKEYHARNRAIWHDVGFIEEPLHGRRRYFMDGEDPEAMSNFPIQSCHPEWTRILTKDGGIEKIGNCAQSGTCWTGERWAEYKRLDMGTSELVHVELNNGQVLDCDVQHSYLIEESGAYAFRKAIELREGDRVCLGMALPLEAGVQGITETDAYWMGFALGNGCTTSQRPLIQMTFGDRKGRYSKEHKANEFILWAASKGELPWSPQVHDGSITVSVQSAQLKASWEELGYPWGENAHTKRVPDSVWCASLNARKAFLRGLLAADGTVGCYPKTLPALHMCNLPLLREVQVLLRTVGVSADILPDLQEGISHRLDLQGQQACTELQYGTRRVRRARVHGVLAPQCATQKFLQSIEGRSLGRQTSESTLRHRMKNGGSTSVYVLREMCEKFDVDVPELYEVSCVKSVQRTAVTVPVYTLSVEHESHRYWADGAISKNCAAADVNDAMCRVIDAFPWGFAGPNTGLCHYNYDSIGIEVPAHMALEVGTKVVDLMHSSIGDMPLPVDLGIGPNWFALTEYSRNKETGVFEAKNG